MGYPGSSPEEGYRVDTIGQPKEHGWIKRIGQVPRRNDREHREQPDVVAFAAMSDFVATRPALAVSVTNMTTIMSRFELLTTCIITK